ncbi:MAG: hypothetical protein O2898_08605 [Proteobacteria bacterium]|nr:hypothetical protein [Pseudomonadota bacterium]
MNRGANRAVTADPAFDHEPAIPLSLCGRSAIFRDWAFQPGRQPKPRMVARMMMRKPGLKGGGTGHPMAKTRHCCPHAPQACPLRRLLRLGIIDSTDTLSEEEKCPAS